MRMGNFSSFVKLNNVGSTSTQRYMRPVAASRANYIPPLDTGGRGKVGKGLFKTMMSLDLYSHYHQNLEKVVGDTQNKLPQRTAFQDKGTALETTVYVNRPAFDQILYASTYGEPKWQEMGVDDDKCWVVINGQRLESEHSPEEKAIRKRMKDSLLDYLPVRKNNYKGKNSTRLNKPNESNIKALQDNKTVVNILKKIFRTKDFSSLVNQIS